MLNRKKLLYAGVFLLFSTGLATAAPAVATTDLNVRAGEGTEYPVIGQIPGGSVVEVAGCGDGWCFVPGYGGYASAAYLNAGAGAYGYVPPATVVVPAPVYEPYYYDPGPAVSFGFGFGNWGHRWHRHHWH